MWKQPFCQKCETTFNLQIDHIIEHQNNLQYFLDPNNLQTLCIRCHSQKTLQNQKLKKLIVRKDVFINLNFDVPINLSKNVLKITNNYYFLTTGICAFSRFDNFYNFNFINKNLDYQSINLLCQFLIKFFINQK